MGNLVECFTGVLVPVSELTIMYSLYIQVAFFFAYVDLLQELLHW